MINFDADNILPPEKPFWKNSKFWLNSIFAIILLAVFFWFRNLYLSENWTEDELVQAIGFSEINSYWKVGEKIDEPDFKGFIITPEIQFRIINKSKRAISNLYLIAVFRFIESGKNIGDTFKMLFQKQKLLPQQESPVITITSLFGYRIRNLQLFDRQRGGWESAMIDIYMRTHNSKLTFIKNFYISKKVIGIDETEIKLR